MPAPQHPTAASKSPGIDRVLHLATNLFGIATAAVVLAGPGALRVEAIVGDESCRADAIASAAQLFETLAAATTPADGANQPPGVLEDITVRRGYAVATPILSAEGRCLGALCLLDRSRRTLMSALQRRLFAEFGGLAASSLRDRPTVADDAAQAQESAALLQRLADQETDAVALFDAEGRCLLRNSRFDALLASRSGAKVPAVAAARGREAAWLAGHLARDLDPVGVYHAALADGDWLCVEERRTPEGFSLVGRVEPRHALAGRAETQMLFERCPFAMFVVDRDTRAVLAANAAALTLYGWDPDALHRVDPDSIAPEPAGAAFPDAIQDWTHRTRDGRPIGVSGRSIELVHRGRPAMLVTVTARTVPTETRQNRGQAA